MNRQLFRHHPSCPPPRFGDYDTRVIAVVTTIHPTRVQLLMRCLLCDGVSQVDVRPGVAPEVRYAAPA